MVQIVLSFDTKGILGIIRISLDKRKTGNNIVLNSISMAERNSAY